MHLSFPIGCNLLDSTMSSQHFKMCFQHSLLKEPLLHNYVATEVSDQPAVW